MSSGTLGARFAQYSRLRRAVACARFCAPWRMYQVNVERSTPIVKKLVSRVLSSTSVLSTTASRSMTGDICFRRGQTFALRVARCIARARTRTIVSMASVVTKVAIRRITPGASRRLSIRRNRQFALSRRRTGAGNCQACLFSGAPCDGRRRRATASVLTWALRFHRPRIASGARRGVLQFIQSASLLQPPMGAIAFDPVSPPRDRQSPARPRSRPPCQAALRRVVSSPWHATLDRAYSAVTSQ